MVKKCKFTFVDIFAGIGGFHQALEKLGGQCVLASEIDLNCVKIYKDNFPETPIVGDIRMNLDKLPSFDMLCAGFPCQPFSKAGKQKGFEDENRGNLFYILMDILKLHSECKFILFENVSNLTTGNSREWWNKIQEELVKQNFYVTDEPIVLSPHEFGIPQIRERVYILGIRKDIRDLSKLNNHFIHIEDLHLKRFNNDYFKNGDAFKILEKEVDNKYLLSEDQLKILNIWDEFREGTNFDKMGVPIWVEYFGINKNSKDFYTSPDYKGVLFKDLPKRKKRFVYKNRIFYLKHKKFIDDWNNRYNILEKNSVYKKFERNAGEDARFLKDTIIQFRHSGIRAKRSNYYPTLVAINNTPIVYDENLRTFRRLTVKEEAKLQSFNDDFIFNENDYYAYKQLGNAVNVKVINKLAKELIDFSVKDWREK